MPKATKENKVEMRKHIEKMEADLDSDQEMSYKEGREMRKKIDWFRMLLDDHDEFEGAKTADPKKPVNLGPKKKTSFF